jgi:hypothetical protein
MPLYHPSSLRVLLGGLVVIAGVHAAGCAGKVAPHSTGASGSGGSGSGGGYDAPSCVPDATLACGDAAGYSCEAGVEPSSQDPSLACDAAPGATGNDYCCFQSIGDDDSSCTPDDAVTETCDDPGAYGYQCSSGEDPTALDSSLTCSAGVPDPDGVATDFCCAYAGDGSSGGSSGSGAPPGCAIDPTVDCSASGADGYSCAVGDNPQGADGTLSCSTSTAGADGDVLYCCFPWTYGDATCTPDDELTIECSDPGAYGYQCSSPADDPVSLDPGLTCSSGVADPDGVHTDYCCIP